MENTHPLSTLPKLLFLIIISIVVFVTYKLCIPSLVSTPQLFFMVPHSGINGFTPLYDMFKRLCDYKYNTIDIGIFYKKYTDNMKLHYENCFKLPNEIYYYPSDVPKRHYSAEHRRKLLIGLNKESKQALFKSNPGIYEPGKNSYTYLDGHIIANGTIELEPDKNLGKLIEQVFNGKLKTQPSGYFWYPPKGFRAWHTNRRNTRGWRMYIVYTYNEGKSGMSYKDYNTGKLHTVTDRNGYVNLFHINTNEPHEPLFWHSVFSDTHRFSLGLNITDEFAHELLHNQL